MTGLEKGRANVYAELGYANAEKMLVEVKLMTAIRKVIETRG
ncbi:helix-turn-helix domain-containing protein [Paraburkholderia humisilvae]|nr:helix-turn-helix domain-containing protein [Paraburkholderia humisilvae]